MPTTQQLVRKGRKKVKKVLEVSPTEVQIPMEEKSEGKKEEKKPDTRLLKH